jgi:hypothetical protein
MLTENIDLTGIDGYSLRHLGHHLCLAGRAAELHKLLALEQSAAGSRAVNIWFAAHEQAADIQSYLSDLSLALADAAASTDRHLADHRSPEALGQEIRYLLIAGTIASRASNITADLLGMTVSAGLWSPGRALDHARLLTSASDRIQAFNILRPLLTPELLDGLNAEALDAAACIHDDQRGAALAILAPHLPADLLDRAVAVADAISDEASRAQALTGLAPHVAAEQRHAVLTRALTAATAVARRAGPLISGDARRATALADLAPHLPADLLDRAVAVADAISDEASRAQALTGLAPHVAAEQRHAVLTRALAAASGVDHPTVSLVRGGGPERAKALTDLAPHLPDELLNQALSSALTIGDEPSRAEALTGLARYLPNALLARALAAVSDFTSSQPQLAQVLAALAPHLPARLRADAIALADAIDNDVYRGQALLALAPYLSEDLLAQAAASTGLNGSPQGLVGLAPHLPTDLYAQAVTVAASIELAFDRADTLTHLAPYAPTALRSAVLSQAVAAVGACAGGAYHYRLPSVVAVLAPQLPANLLAQVTDTTAAIRPEELRAESLAALAPHLPANLLDRALSAATAIEDDNVRGRALASLAPYVPARQRLDVVAQAVAAASATADAAYSASALGGLAPYAHPQQQHAILAGAVTAVEAIRDSASRAAVLTELAPQLPADLLARALDIAAAINSDSDLARALAGLAPHLPADLLLQAVTIAMEAPMRPWEKLTALASFVPHLSADHRTAVLAEIPALTAALPRVINDSFRVTALTAMAPYLHAEALTRAASAVSDITDARSRARALTALTSHMPADQRKAVLGKALSAVAEIADGRAHISALAELAPHLPADLLPRAINGINAIKWPPSQIEALVSLTPYLPANLLSQLVTAVIAVADETWRAAALADLAPQLSAELIDRALAAATAMNKEDAKATALAGLMPYLTAEHQPDALNQALAAAHTAGPAARAAAFIAVATHVPGDMRQFLLGEALTASVLIQDGTTRANILAKLAPHLSAELLTRAIATAATITDEWRTAALARLVPYADSTQLAQAIDARPESRNYLLKTAIIAKISNGLPNDAWTNCVDLIRAGMTGANRHEALAAIESAAQVIAGIGGTTAINDCAQAADAVNRWWN